MNENFEDRLHEMCRGETPWDSWGEENPYAQPGDYGRVVGIHGASTHPSRLHDVVEIVHDWSEGGTFTEGSVFGVVRLSDGRYLSWTSWTDVTGTGFYPDAYGGNTDIFYSNSLEDAINFGLEDWCRDIIEGKDPGDVLD